MYHREWSDTPIQRCGEPPSPVISIKGRVSPTGIGGACLHVLPIFFSPLSFLSSFLFLSLFSILFFFVFYIVLFYYFYFL